MKYLFCLLSILLISIPLYSAEKCSIDGPSCPNIGLEVDAYSYISGGYHGSYWIGNGKTRGRIIFARAYPPESYLPEGFKDIKIDVLAFMYDYFFSNNLQFDGFWAGAGVEYWDCEAINKFDGHDGDYKNFQFTLSGGYVWKFYHDFYLTPGASVHYRFTGDDEVLIGDSILKPAKFIGEVSMKIGWYL